MLAGKAVGVVSIGEQTYLDVHAFFQQHVNTAYAGLDSGSVTVIQYRNVIGKTMNQSYLVGGQCRTRRSHHVFNSTLVHGNDIGITFNQEAAVLAYNGLLGKINAIEFPAFVIYLRFRRIDILHLYVLGGSAQYTSAKSYHFSRQGMYGENDTPPETVAKRTVVLSIAQAGFYQKLFLIAFLFGCTCQCIVTVCAVS